MKTDTNTSGWRLWDTVPRDGTMIVAMLSDGHCYTVDQVDEDGMWYLNGDGAQFDERDDLVGTWAEPMAWLPMDDWHIKLIRAGLAFSKARGRARCAVAMAD